MKNKSPCANNMSRAAMLAIVSVLFACSLGARLTPVLMKIMGEPVDISKVPVRALGSAEVDELKSLGYIE